MSATMTIKIGQRAGWMLVALFCASCTTMPEKSHTPPDRVTISNLRYGPVCGPNNAQTICSQTSDISVTGDGRCIYDHREIACTWYAFSFDYAPLAGPVALDCTYNASMPGDIGNPEGVQSKHSTGAPYQIQLDNSGHLFHSQYMGWVGETPDDDIKQACFYKGEKLFDVEFRLHFQPVPGTRKDA
jgi:hypothetical protein